MLALVISIMLASAPDAPFLCTCANNATPADIEFRGVAVDAVLVAAEGGTKVELRQATVFRVTRVIKGEAASPMKVWHLTNPGRCGVTFNYASTYRVKARLKNGRAETDLCLMPELKPKSE